MGVLSILVGAVALLHGVDVTTAECNGVYSNGNLFSPLDVCTSFVNGDASSSSMWSCGSGVPKKTTYNAAGCYSTSAYSSIDYSAQGYTCSGDDVCDYVVQRTYETDGNGCSTTDYTDEALFVGYCFNQLFSYSCTACTATRSTYGLASDCTGAADTTELGDVCSEVIECTADSSCPTPTPTPDTAAQCNGVYLDGDLYGPLDVCADDVWTWGDGGSTSKMWSCVNGVLKRLTYTGTGCNSNNSLSSIDLSATGYTAVCSGGAACDYVVLREYDDNTDAGGCSTTDYTDRAYFVGICTSDPPFSAEMRCTDSNATTSTYYGSSDCTGDADSIDPELRECQAVVQCTADTTPAPVTPAPVTPAPVDNPAPVTPAPVTPAPTDSDTDMECSGLYLFGTAVSPLDVCANTMNGTASSSKYTCDNGVGTVMYYDSADCTGTGVSVPDAVGTFTTIVCDGMDCDYAVLRTYEGDYEDGDECGENYSEAAVFTDRCFPSTDSSTVYSCDGTTGTITNYTSEDCSGDAVSTESTDDDACDRIVTCSSDNDGGDDGEDNGDGDDTDGDGSDGDDVDDGDDDAATAQCNGVYAGDTPIGPLDVCTDSLSGGIVSSSMYSCEDDVPKVLSYSAAGCNSADFVDSRNTLFTAVCSGGDACDYLVLRTFDNDTDGCTDDYTDTAWFVGICVETDSSSADFSCADSTVTASTYGSSDCTGAADTTEPECTEVVECNTDSSSGNDPDTDTDNGDGDNGEDDPEVNGSAASLPAAVLALGVASIALIA